MANPPGTVRGEVLAAGAAVTLQVVCSRYSIAALIGVVVAVGEDPRYVVVADRDQDG